MSSDKYKNDVLCVLDKMLSKANNSLEKCNINISKLTWETPSSNSMYFLRYSIMKERYQIMVNTCRKIIAFINSDSFEKEKSQIVETSSIYVGRLLRKEFTRMGYSFDEIENFYLLEAYGIKH